MAHRSVPPKFLRRLNSAAPTAVPPSLFAGTPQTTAVPPSLFAGTQQTTAVPPSLFAGTQQTTAVPPSLFAGTQQTTAVPPSLFAGTPQTTAPPPPTTTTSTDPIINLTDPKKLFSSVSTTKLIKSSITLYMASWEPMADFGSWVMNSKLVQSPLTKDIVLKAIEHSFYQHFCAGKDLERAGLTMAKLWDAGLRAMLDYGLEHANDNQSCDRNLDEFIGTIGSTKSVATSPVSFVVVKITAICPPRLLRRVSDLLRWEYKDSSLHLPWKLKTLPIFTESSPLYHTLTKPDPLTYEEERDLNLAYQRLVKICQKSSEANVPLLIDAEDTDIQPAIDYLTYSATIEYNRGDSPLIFNTIQAYLKDAKERMVTAKRAADEMAVPMGFKLVRGAYMSREKRLAYSLHVRSPIHDSIQETHACYNECAAFMLEQIANGSGSVVLATHNLESGKLAATEAVNLGIEKDSPNLQFAQLYGMAEALSLGLKNAGFRVSKYLPFGPVEQIMPYLLRRAEENKGLLSTTAIDRELMSKELLRRLTSPPGF